MNFIKTLFIIGVITLAIIAVIIVATACVIAGRESRKEDKDDGEIH